MGGRAWSQEELIRLEELTEKYPLATVARKLNRSENAVFLKRQRTGIGGFIANTDMLTRNTLSRILGAQRAEKRPEEAIRDVPAAGHHQIHGRTSGRLECSQDHRRLPIHEI